MDEIIFEVFLLRELQDLCGVALTLMVCQPAEIPDEVKPGLSDVIQRAVRDAAGEIASQCHRRSTLRAE